MGPLPWLSPHLVSQPPWVGAQGRLAEGRETAQWGQGALRASLGGMEAGQPHLWDTNFPETQQEEVASTGILGSLWHHLHPNVPPVEFQGHSLHLAESESWDHTTLSSCVTSVETCLGSPASEP